MLRENPKWKPHKGKSTEAEHRGGVTRCSVEGYVMKLERRGHIVQFWNFDQPINWEESID